MDREGENTVQKPRRSVAGVNKGLADDFVWPRGFGAGSRGNVSRLTEGKPMNVPPISANPSSLPEFENSKVDMNVTQKSFFSDRSHSPGKNGKYVVRSVISSKGSHASLDLQKKRLLIQTERDRQDLEKMKEDFEKKQKEIENRMKILQLEHDVKEAELEAAAEAENNGTFASTSSKVSKIDKHTSIVNWIKNVDVVEPIIDNPPHIVPTVTQPRDDVNLLCQAISDVIKNVAPSGHDKFLARHIVDKDFPIFDGNPEDWPIFYQRYQQVCRMCEYTPDEILIKLQKCLRGEAKSAVAGMLLTSENVGLILETLHMRFGRADHVIEVMITKIKAIPPLREIHIEKLITLSNEIRNLVSTAKALLSYDYLRNPQLIKELLAKLPDTLKLKWGEVIMLRKDTISLEDFSTWLGDIAMAASFVSAPSSKSLVSDNKHHLKKSHNLRKAETMLSTDVERKYVCLYCSGEHNENSCPTMKSDDVETRWKKITDKKLCFSCLKKGHHRFRCKKRQECKINGCKYFHHPLLHKTFDVRTTGTSDDSEVTTANGNELVYSVRHETNKVLLRMLPVNIFGPNGMVEILAICDEASTVSLVDESVIKQLGLHGEKEALCLQWTNEIVSRFDKSERVTLNISAACNNSKIFKMENVRTVEKLSLPAQTINMEHWRKYPHLKDLPMKSLSNEKPMLLIGQDNTHLIIPRQIRNGPESLPIATKCKLGWSLHGPCPGRGQSQGVHTLHICDTIQMQDDYLHELIKQSFSTEAFGVAIRKPKENESNKRSLEIMEATTRRIGNRYETGLLWKSDEVELPDSKSNALHRLKCVERKLLKNKTLAKDYCNKINSYLEKGYAKKLSPEEVEMKSSRTWYLPHFGVENPNKPGKLRLVFDAAAKVDGMSLNDNLLSGPDLLQSLISILWKFRQRKYGFCGDISEMFHQVRIREADQCAQRFLWRNLDTLRPPDTYQMKVMTFGATCSPVCAQFVKNLNAREQATSSDISEAIISKFYVDDYLDSVDTEEEALEKVKEVRRVNQLGGFQVVNWISNSLLVRRILSEDTMVLKKLEDGNCATQRVLGIWWDSKSDELLIKFNAGFDSHKLFTKRQILRFIMSLFDPLGLIAYLTVRGKILMQDVWRSRIGWDEMLPDNLQSSWRQWLEDLYVISEVRIPRCYSIKIPTAISIELHMFSDASEEAFAAVAYLRTVSIDSIDVSLVSSKTRVAPLKPLSIPRLELQAAVMASRLCYSILDNLELKINRVFLWTDSSCVLNWIKNDGRKYKQFVAHRIGEIQELTDLKDWRWINTLDNVADEATRRINKNSHNVLSKRWFNGPDFLKESENHWPVRKNENELCQDLSEMKIEYTAVTSHIERDFLPDIRRFSKWVRLVRTTAWILKFRKILVQKIKKTGNANLQRHITVDEIEEAERYWIKEVQIQSFGEDLEKLKKGKVLNRNSRLKSLNPILDQDELMILDGRTDLADCMSFRTKKPYILSPHHEYTKLLLQYYHDKYRHQGIETILNAVRQKYWVIDGRAAVKSTFGRCMICRRSRATPDITKMGQLPIERVSPDVRAFVNVGMDYFGPLFVTVGRRKEKRWGVLFTCLAIRAIHLEVAHSLTTDSAIMAIRRMINRRGKPMKIFCDNGTNLRGAAEELKKALLEMNPSAIINDMTMKGVEFKFIPPQSPNMGGAWERLIGSVKKVMGKALHSQSLRDETLLTLFAEAENIVNSRPLTHISVDANDPEPLTPNHFLLGYVNRVEAPCSDPDQVTRKEWRKSQMLANIFWKRWTREFLPKLTKRAKWTDDSQPIKKGDIVIIVDDHAPRNNWKLGKIEALFPGPDGRIRVADVRTESTIFRRPVNKLCRLHINSEEN